MDLSTLDESEIEGLSYRNLQTLCKANKIRANQKTAALKEKLICLKRQLTSESTQSSQASGDLQGSNDGGKSENDNQFQSDSNASNSTTITNTNSSIVTTEATMNFEENIHDMDTESDDDNEEQEDEDVDAYIHISLKHNMDEKNNSTNEVNNVADAADVGAPVVNSIVIKCNENVLKRSQNKTQNDDASDNVIEQEKEKFKTTIVAVQGEDDSEMGANKEDVIENEEQNMEITPVSLDKTQEKQVDVIVNDEKDVGNINNVVSNEEREKAKEKDKSDESHKENDMDMENVNESTTGSIEVTEKTMTIAETPTSETPTLETFDNGNNNNNNNSNYNNPQKTAEMSPKTQATDKIMDNNSMNNNDNSNSNSDSNNNEIAKNEETSVDADARASILAELDMRMQQSGYSGVSTNANGKTEYVSLNSNNNTKTNLNSTSKSRLKRADKSKGSKNWDSIHDKQWKKGPSLGDWFDAKQKRAQKLLQGRTNLSSTARKADKTKPKTVTATTARGKEKTKRNTKTDRCGSLSKTQNKNSSKNSSKSNSISNGKNGSKLKSKRLSNTTKMTSKTKSIIHNSKTQTKKRKQRISAANSRHKNEKNINNGNSNSNNRSNSVSHNNLGQRGDTSKTERANKIKSRKLSGIQPNKGPFCQQWKMGEEMKMDRIGDEIEHEKEKEKEKEKGGAKNKDKKSRKSILIKQDSENVGVNQDRNISSKESTNTNKSKSSSISSESVQNMKSRMSKKKRRMTDDRSLMKKHGRKSRSAQKVNGQGWKQRKMSLHSRVDDTPNILNNSRPFKSNASQKSRQSIDVFNREGAKLNVKLNFNGKEEHIRNNNNNHNNNNKGVSRLIRPTIASSGRSRSKIKKRTFDEMMSKQNNGNNVVGINSGMGMGIGGSGNFGMGTEFGASSKQQTGNKSNNNGFNGSRLPRKRLAYDPSKVKAKVNSHNHNAILNKNKRNSSHNDENSMNVSNVPNVSKLSHGSRVNGSNNNGKKQGLGLGASYQSLSKIKQNWSNVQSKVDCGIRKHRKSLPGKQPIKYHEESVDIDSSDFGNGNGNDNENTTDDIDILTSGNGNSNGDQPPIKRRRISKC